MTNLEGRVIRRRRALPPPDGVLDDLQLSSRRWPTGSAAGATSPATRPRCSTSCGGPAPAASPTTPASPTSGSTRSRASSGPARPRTIPARRGCSPTRSRPPTAGRRFIRVEHRAPAESPDARLPVRAHHRPADGAVPERHPDPAGPALAQTEVQPEVQLHPDLARALGIATADIVELTLAAGQRRRSAPGSPTRSGPTRCSCPFHWGGASAANALTNPVLDPLSRMPAFKVCAVGSGRIGVARRRPPADPTARPTPSTPRHTRPTLNQLLQPIPQEGPPHDHQEPLPARHLPLRGRRPGQAGADQRELTYVVPDGVISQALYFRGGNTTDELITVVLMRDGVPMRYFPIGAKGDVHVPLRVVEDIEGGSVVELHLVAPLGSDRHRGRRPRPGGALMTITEDRAASLSTGLRLHGSTTHATSPPSSGRDRQRHGRRARGRGDPGPRRRRAVRDHHVRRRAVRQLQPDHAEPRALRRGDRRRHLPQHAWTGTTRTTSPCTPVCGSSGSTGSPRSSSPTTAPVDPVRPADHRHRQPVVHARDGGPVPATLRRLGELGPAARRLRVPHPRRHPGDDRVRRSTTITAGPS